MPQPCEAKVGWSAPDFLIRAMTPEYLRLEKAFPAFVYVIQSGEDGPVKIGSAGRPSKRLANMQTGCWQDLFLRAAVPTPRSTAVELAAHVLARDYSIRGEWFDLAPYEAVSFVLEAMAVLKLEAVPLKPLVSGLKPMKAWESKGPPPDYAAAKQAVLRRKLGIE